MRGKMKAWKIELQERWEAFLTSGVEGPLLKVLIEHPEAMIPCEHAYPYLHRVIDAILNGQPHRVLRCTLCHEELTFRPIPSDIATPDQGVPHWLKGLKLRRWTEEEAEFPSKGDIDWERFR